MATKELRFFITLPEARARLVEMLEEGSDDIFEYRPRELIRIRSTVQLDALRQRPLLVAGRVPVDAISSLDIPLGDVVSLILPSGNVNTLEKSSLSIKWDPASRDASAQLDRYARWRRAFTRGLRGGVRWRYVNPSDAEATIRPASERFSQGALELHRRGGRWIQAGVPHQEWLPPEREIE
jgi:hypothetical protein